ncbi:MAG: hypothetical protein ACRDOK_15730 [Streptosporangiaceae bacterium]
MASAGRPRGPGAGLRLRWLLAVLAVIVVLTAGWPLVGSTVAGHRPLAAGTTITVGPTAASSGRVTVGPGWSVMTASTNPHWYYSIARGPLRMSVRYVSLARAGEPGALWRGLRQILRIGNPGVTPGRPRQLTTADGSRGLIAALSGPGRTGQAAVVAAPARPFAIEMIMTGPSRTARAVRAAGMPIIRSLRLPAAAR